MSIPDAGAASDFLGWVKMAPYILIHYAPGFITIATYRFLRNGNKRMSEIMHFGACICLSYLLNFIPWLYMNESPQYLCGIVSMFIGVVLATAAYFIRKVPFISWFLARFTETALDDCVLDGCRLYSLGRRVIVYTNDAIIKGRVQLYNQEENDNWLALDDVTYVCTDNKNQGEWSEQEIEYERYLIPFEEIKMIRSGYHKSIKGDERMIPGCTNRVKKEWWRQIWLKLKKLFIRKGKK